LFSRRGMKIVKIRSLSFSYHYTWDANESFISWLGCCALCMKLTVSPFLVR
jgi:hypothetical protein